MLATLTHSVFWQSLIFKYKRGKILNSALLTNTLFSQYLKGEPIINHEGSRVPYISTCGRYEKSPNYS